MSDSRIGVFGVIALISSFIMKFSAICQLPPNFNTYLHLILISMLSRYHMLLFLRFLKPLKNNGLGKGYRVHSNKTLLIGLLPILPFLFLLNLSGIIIFFSILIISLSTLKVISDIFKGQTGDICGASQQISEISGLLILTLLI